MPPAKGNDFRKEVKNRLDLTTAFEQVNLSVSFEHRLVAVIRLLEHLDGLFSGDDPTLGAADRDVIAEDLQLENAEVVLAFPEDVANQMIVRSHLFQYS